MALPKEARDGIMRVWLEILREKHPGVQWIPVEPEKPPEHEPADDHEGS